MQGVPVDYPEFVIYDNHRCMIEYIVTCEEIEHREAPRVAPYNPNMNISLYKNEVIILPMEEEELDRMYMFLPDTG